MAGTSGKQSIRCDVKSCEYNNCDVQSCELRSIQVAAKPNGSSGMSQDESMCASYKAQA